VSRCAVPGGIRKPKIFLGEFPKRLRGRDTHGQGTISDGTGESRGGREPHTTLIPSREGEGGGGKGLSRQALIILVTTLKSENSGGDRKKGSKESKKNRKGGGKRPG